MNIDTPVRELGPVEFEPLRDAVLAMDEVSWGEDQFRQKVFDVHYNTQSLVLLFVDLDQWPRIVISQAKGWEPLAEVAMPLVDRIIDQHYEAGGVVVRAMAARLDPGARILPHVDKHPSFHRGHRIHIPISTNHRVRFMIDGVPYRFTPGNAYEINNQKPHSVMNNGKTARIHFIFDYVPASELVSSDEAKH